ncbi:MAG: phosphoglycerate kinase [Chloroflexi bacterium]|nr:phosphoglycerate kinase [Chloroflexota bacterium]
MQKKDVVDVEVGGKRILLRVDFNVPLDMSTGAIKDDSRIRASLPTIKYLLDHRAKVILCSHLGRPGGRVDEGLRMKPVAQHLSQLINLTVDVAPDCVGSEVEERTRELREGSILLLENLRFHPEEEANKAWFARDLARLADIYVNDAFGTAHRAHASTVGVAKHLPAVAGFLMEKELVVMSELLGAPRRPFACVIGGAKVSDKMGLIQNMLRRVDILLIGGGMAATLLKAQGYEVGRSLVEDDRLDLARELLTDAREQKVAMLLPVDVLVAREIKAEAESEIVPIANIHPSSQIVDVGPETTELFSRQLVKCQMVMWNGPMGIYEIPRFSEGTRSLVRLLSTLTAITVVGGGSSADIVREMGLGEKMTHVSTGGGATLEFLEGATLPGVEALLDKM